MYKNKPHYDRRANIHGIFLILFVVILWSLFGCSPRNGCRATRGMAGYAWLKCNETGKTIITDMDGKIVCSYYDKPSK